jgi:hypothetical protein
MYVVGLHWRGGRKYAKLADTIQEFKELVFNGLVP